MTDVLNNWTPLGSQTRSKSLASYGLEGLIGLADMGSGAMVHTTDSRWLIDWVCGLGAISLGYQRHEVDEAVERQLRRGSSFSLPSYLEQEVAEQLCQMLKWPEQVRFVKTGSEATEAAIRIARRATGRDIILTVGDGYHSWHSWFQAVKPDHPGIPHAYEGLVESFSYNDLQSLDDAYERVGWRGGPAAIILEPTLFEAPAPGFLESVRARATRWGAILIFDEMVLGFRLALGGGSDYFGVRPDLACYGKGLANGTPLACVVGKRELLKFADVVSGTFGGECLSLAAAQAVLTIYNQEDVIRCLHKTGLSLDLGFLELIGDASTQAWAYLTGWPVVNRLCFRSPTGDKDDNKALGLFTQQMAQRGVLWHPRIRYVSAAHTAEHVEKTVEAAGESLQVVKHALDSGDWSALKGSPPAQAFVRKA